MNPTEAISDILAENIKMHEEIKALNKLYNLYKTNFEDSEEGLKETQALLKKAVDVIDRLAAMSPEHDKKLCKCFICKFKQDNKEELDNLK